jgi:glycogen debranching enzyme
MDEQELKMKLLDDIEKLKTPEGCLYAGLPHFKGIWGRDSIITSWQLLGHDASIAKNTLKFLAKFQGKKNDWKTDEAPGKILHIYDYIPYRFPHRILDLFERITKSFPYYGSVDATPLFVVVANEYLQKTGDKELIEEIWANIEKAVNWMIDYGDLDKDDFVEYKRKNPFGVKNQNWKDALPYINMKLPVAAVEMQGYAYAAFRAAVLIAEILNKESYDWKERADRLKKSFNEKFWMEDLNFFALALDGNKQQIKEIASNPGHLLFTGIVDKDKIKKLVERIFENDMFTPYGIRCHSSSSKYFNPDICHLGPIWPHDNWMIWIGLKKYGYTEETEKIKTALIGTYRELQCIPEFYDVVNDKPVIVKRHGMFFGFYIPIRKPCCPQAWASGALLNMISQD